MQVLDHLYLGFSVALSPTNLLYSLYGAALGTLIGVLPGIGPVATISILLPVTFYLSPASALIMLAGIYYGAQYGGSTSAILVNLPGESSSVVTCLDGHQMARQGRAGAALGVAALGSFFAGTVATVLIAIFAPPLGEFALAFNAPEYAALMVLGLIAAVVLARGSVLKALAMVFIGLLLGTVGTDVNSGVSRFSFNLPQLSDGIDFVVIVMGMFGFSEIISNLETRQNRDVISAKIGRILPSLSDIRASWKPVMRGTVLGSVLGIFPGGGAVLSAFASYSMEKKLAKDPSRFGRGAIEGVAGPEAANNAGAQTSFIPLLTLGIPSNAVMAMMIGAMMIHGIRPGPQLMTNQPDLFWGLIASMWVGNLMLLVLNLPLIGLWVRLLRVPYKVLFPCILLLCCIGIYSLNRSGFDLVMAAGFGLLGYIFIKIGCEPAPLLLGFVLGPMLEEYFRRAMLISQGNPMIFITRPISGTLIALVVILLVLVLLPSIRKGRETAFKE